MSVALRSGLTGILAAQQGLSLVGQNIANAGTPNYARRTLTLESTEWGTADRPAGGVTVADIRRIVDNLLEQRIYGQEASHGEAEAQVSYLSQVEALLQEPGEHGLSSSIARFFESMDALAAESESTAIRAGVLQEAINLCDSIHYLQDQLTTIREAVYSDIEETVSQVNILTEAIHELNQNIASAGTSGGSPLGMMDNRQQYVNELSKGLGVQVTYDDLGRASIRAGNLPIVAATSRLEVHAPATEDGAITVGEGRIEADITSGRLHGLMDLMQNQLPGYMESLDAIAASLIQQVNKVHAEGVGLDGSLASVVAENRTTDPLGVGNGSDTILADAGFAFDLTSGDLTINVTDTTTETTAAYTVAIDADSMTLSDVAAAIGALTGLGASTSNGKITIAADSGYAFDFCADQDTNFLAVAGINAFFTGDSAATINVSTSVSESFDNIAAAQSSFAGDGTNASRMAELQTASVVGGSSASFQGAFETLVTEIGSDSAIVQSKQTAHNALLTSLKERRESTSGVSLDEEAVRLIEYQQMYTVCSRFVATVNNLMDKMLQYLS